MDAFERRTGLTKLDFHNKQVRLNKYASEVSEDMPYLSDVRFCHICQIYRFVRLSDLPDLSISAILKNAGRTNRWMDRPTDERTDPLIEIRGRI